MRIDRAARRGSTHGVGGAVIDIRAGAAHTPDNSTANHDNCNGNDDRARHD